MKAKNLISNSSDFLSAIGNAFSPNKIIHPFTKPDFKDIEEKTKDSGGQFNFGSLYNRYKNFDFTLTQQDFYYLYYGSAIHNETYKSLVDFSKFKYFDKNSDGQNQNEEFVLHNFMKVILNTGNGAEINTGFHIVNEDHEKFFLIYCGLRITGRQMTIRNKGLYYDCVELWRNELDVKIVFFDRSHLLIYGDQKITLKSKNLMLGVLRGESEY